MMNSKVEPLSVLEMKPRITGTRIGTIVGMAADGLPLVDFRGNPLGAQRARKLSSITDSAIADACAHGDDVLLLFAENDAAQPIIVDAIARPRGAGSLPPQSPSTIVRCPVPGGDTGPGLRARLARIVSIEADNILIESEDSLQPPQHAKSATVLRNLHDPVVVVSLTDGSAVVVAQVFPTVQIEPEARGADVVLRGSRVRIEADTELVLQAGQCTIHLDARGKALTTADQIVSRARGANKVQGGSVQLN